MRMDDFAKPASGVPSYFKRRNSCRLCECSNLELAVGLSPIPIITPNIDLNSITHEQKVRGGALSAPMDLYVCTECRHLQILDVIDPNLQYQHFRYRTSISLGLPEHFRRMADELIASAALKPGAFIVEIGSNDGTLLRAFKERGFRVLGIDPARETARQASESGIETLDTFFDAQLGSEIVAKYGMADLIVANNTFANIDDLSDAAVAIDRVLGPEGMFVFETSYGADVIDKFLLDTIYHEHLSYFMVRPLFEYFRKHSFELYDVQNIWTKGGSIRGFVKRNSQVGKACDSVSAWIERERIRGFETAKPYNRFADKLGVARARLSEITTDYVNRNQTIAAYGASIGSVTLLQQFGLGPSISFIVDDNPLADVMIGPDYRIPVLSPQALYERNPALTLVFAWRYASHIAASHARYMQNGGAFFLPLPDPHFL